MSVSLKFKADLASLQLFYQTDCRLISHFHRGVGLTTVEDPPGIAVQSDLTPFEFLTILSR